LQKGREWANIVLQTVNLAVKHHLLVELPPDDGSWGGPRAEFVGQFTGNATLFSQSLDYVDPTKVALLGYCVLFRRNWYSSLTKYQRKWLATLLCFVIGENPKEASIYLHCSWREAMTF
jgi:hypothetical protein